MALVYVLALITGKDDSKSELERELKAVIPTVRKEDGCLRYDLHLSADGKPLFMFYETWQSKEALAATARRRICLPCGIASRVWWPVRSKSPYGALLTWFPEPTKGSEAANIKREALV